MKRLILIIIGVLLCTPLYSDMNTYVIGSGVAAGGSCSQGSDAIIIGEDYSAGGTYDINAGDITYRRYQALYSCDIDTLCLKVANSGSSATGIRMAIFSDNEGEVGTRLGQTGESLLNGDGEPQDLECTLTSAVSITADTYYWTAEWPESTNGMYYRGSVLATAVSGYQHATYSDTGDFPTPSRTGWGLAPAMYGLSQ